MNARAQKTARTPAPEASSKPARRKRWKVVVDNTGARQAGETHLSADKLQQAALQPRPLPYRADLEGYFGTDLGAINVFEGPEVEAMLRMENAVAAVLGDKMLLSRAADLPVVAHEVAHILQQRAMTPVSPGADPETEALRAEAFVAANRPVQPIRGALDADTVAFRRDDALADEAIVARSDAEARRAFEQARREDAAESDAEPGQAAPDQAAEDRATEEAPADEATTSTAEAQLGEDIPDEPTPTFEPAPMPDIDIDQGAADAAGEAAKEALEGAEDADALVAAFKDAPPSVKAMRHDTLATRTGELAAEDQQTFEAELPEFQAEMSGTDDLAEPAQVATPESRQAELEDGTPPPPPEPELDPTPDPGTPDLNRDARDLLDGLFETGDAGGLGRAFDRVKTADTEVETSAGARPEVPLEGATDPERVTDQDSAARADAVASRQEATQAVLDGPGPEQVELQQLREEFTMEPRPAPEIAESTGPLEGPAAFREKELDPEVVALFDAHHADAMSENLTAAQEEAASAVDTRNTERDAKVSETEAERDRLNEEADRKQREEVGARRQDVQDARQTAVDAQAEHVRNLNEDADRERRETQAEIDGEISATQTEVETKFDQAETDAQTKVDEGEKEADDERARQEREAENKSWWDRATDWVADQFNKLTKFINDVFDAVRSAVKFIIDKVKEAALALIDLAAKAIISAIEAFGEVLKAAVNTLLAEHFPEVARALNSAIDSAVEVATTAVNAIAEGLKAAVSFLLDALAAAIDAILAAYQAAINAALAIVNAVLTGDWAMLAKLILEPVLLALGIQPEAFYEMIARAVEALDIIIDDPIGFLSNLVESVVGGVRMFAGNLLTHLQAGIIGWLTGALGGDIQIPERWDLKGVLELARQVLGLTVDMLRRVAVRVIGEAAVEKIEFFMGYVTELISGGFSALWDKIVQDLGDLANSVLEAIKSFLMERIVMAAITWLASMFSPVGALIKLVMTIWNFIMFLKDQLARIIQVVQKVVSTMYEIATGVLEPAMKGIETVLANLLPIAIDLLARLLGLGNVAGRVKRIIADIRQRIEDALVKLINRVLSAFTGGRLGGGQPGEETAQPGAIMEPVALAGGGEHHTLTIEDQGETVVTMIRSTPMTLESWLDLRLGAPFTELARENGWQGDVVNAKRTELQGLVTRAKQEEGILDREAEQAEDALNDNPAAATDEVAQVADQAQDTKRAIEAILDFFGVAGGTNLAEKFADDIARLNPELATQLRANVLNRLNARIYSTLTWAQARDMIAGEAALPVAWARPAASDGIVRRVFDSDYRQAVIRIAQTEKADAFTGDNPAQELDRFFDNHLTQVLNQPENARRMVAALLNNGGGGGAAGAVSDTIRSVAARALGNQLEHDFKFNEVTGSFYKNTLVPEADRYFRGDIKWPYIEDDAQNTAGSGTSQVKPFGFFLTDSKRASKNRQRLADSVRGANPGQHEWIASRLAAAALSGAARTLESTGETTALKGATEILEFQHKVRTPTAKLIFRPRAGYPSSEQKVEYKSPAHIASEQYRDISPVALPAELQKQWYPANGPQPGERRGVLQGHPGAIYAYALRGDFSAEIKPQVAGHGRWDQDLAKQVTEEIEGNVVTFRDVKEMGENILGFFRETIWRGEAAPTNPLKLYFRSSSPSTEISYEALKNEFSEKYEDVYGTLEAQIQDVIRR